MKIHAFYGSAANTWTYLVIDESTNNAMVVDPVLDYDADTGAITAQSANQLIQYLHTHNLQLQWIVDTHIHADHFTAAYYLQQHLSCKIAISTGVKDVLNYWQPRLTNHTGIPMNGEQFTQLLADNDTITVGNLTVHALHTPGHTPSDMSLLVEDALFTGDVLFLPDVGTGRADFPGGGAHQAFHSLQRLYQLPDNTRVFVGHDYPAQREPQYASTIAEEKANNIMLTATTSEQQFIQQRTTRDAALTAPKLLMHALHVNLRAGQLSDAEYDDVFAGK